MKRVLIRFLMVAIMTIIVGILGLILVIEWAWGGFVKPSLDPQYLPTAEYLLEQPAPTSEYISIYPHPGSTIKSGQTIQINMQTRPIVFPGALDDFSLWTQVFVNHQRIRRDALGVSTLDTLYGSLEFVFAPKLDSGVHLFRFQLGNSINVLLNPDSVLYTYIWAYRVE